MSVKQDTYVSSAVVKDPQAERLVRNPNGTFTITLVKRCDDRTEDDVGEVNYYDTGICFDQEHKFFNILLEGSADLVQSGYMLVTKVIEPDSEDTLKVGLYKFRESDDLDLPYACITAYPVSTPVLHVNCGALKQEKAAIPTTQSRVGSNKAKSHYA